MSHFFMYSYLCFIHQTMYYLSVFGTLAKAMKLSTLGQVQMSSLICGLMPGIWQVMSWASYLPKNQFLIVCLSLGVPVDQACSSRYAFIFWGNKTFRPQNLSSAKEWAKFIRCQSIQNRRLLVPNCWRQQHFVEAITVAIRIIFVWYLQKLLILLNTEPLLSWSYVYRQMILQMIIF